MNSINSIDQHLDCERMAGDTPLSQNTESAVRSVQESAINVKVPAERFRRTGGVSEGFDTRCLPLMEIPVIDFDLLQSPITRGQELEKLRSALSSFGWFLSINHGMTSSFLDEVRSITKKFFALSLEEKQKSARDDSREGYGSDDNVISNGQEVITWNNRLVVALSPEDQRNLKFWPENPANFRDTLVEYGKKLDLITEVVLKAMAMSLNLEEQCFLDKYGARPTVRARFNHVPLYPEHNPVLGIKAHTDPSVITIVLQDKEVEGLQFLKDDQWYRAPIVPEALLINIGDQIEIMSNGLFKSPIHRVVVDPDKERFSVAVFFSSDLDNCIEPVDGLVDESRPRKYKDVKDYVSTFVQYFHQGKSLLEELKIQTC